MIRMVRALLRGITWIARDENSIAPERNLEDGWPARDFSAPARRYLLSEARQRVQEQLTALAAQDLKCGAVITVSVLLVSASGLIGEARIGPSASGILTPMTFAASLVTWVFAWLAYRTRRVGAGVDIATLRITFRHESEQALRDAALETLVLDFGQNEVVLNQKARLLRCAVYAAGVQSLLLLAVLVARALEAG